MRLQGKRIAILAENLYQEMELWVPYYRLTEEGGTVRIIGTAAAKTVTSKHGYPVTVDAPADEVTGTDFDALVIPGGYAPDLMRRSAAMVRLVREAFEAGRVVAAICHAGWVLCSAGILRGKTVTGFFSIRDDMVNAGARFVDQEVVVDGNLITSRKPDDLPAFCRELVKALEKAG
ncbi:MAG: type 1 glutamine amidotransferase domain-containing protein [Candidatus Methylomirabilales bacterium]